MLASQVLNFSVARSYPWTELVLAAGTAHVSAQYSAPHFKGHFRDTAQASLWLTTAVQIVAH